MALKKHPMLMVLFIVVGIMAALALTRLSQLEPAPASRPFPEIQLRGLLPGQSGSEQCCSSIINIEGCFVEIMNALLKGQVAKIGTYLIH